MLRVVGSKGTVKGAVFYFLLQSWNRTFISGPANTWVDTMAAMKETQQDSSLKVCVGVRSWTDLNKEKSANQEGFNWRAGT